MKTIVLLISIALLSTPALSQVEGTEGQIMDSLLEEYANAYPEYQELNSITQELFSNYTEVTVYMNNIASAGRTLEQHIQWLNVRRSMENGLKASAICRDIWTILENCVDFDSFVPDSLKYIPLPDLPLETLPKPEYMPFKFSLNLMLELLVNNRARLTNSLEELEEVIPKIENAAIVSTVRDATKSMKKALNLTKRWR